MIFIIFTKKDIMYGKGRKYTNGEITVYWRPSECIHATYCYKELVEVFDPRKRPWIDMNGAPTEDIIRIVEKCPTNALTFKRNEDIDKGISVTEEKSETVGETEVKIINNGPVIIKGNFKLTGADGTEMQQTNSVSLCRCGKSGKMPFCDGKHREI